MGGRAVGEKPGDKGQEHEVEVGENTAQEKATPVDRGAGGLEALGDEVGDGEVGDGFQRSPPGADEGSADQRFAFAMGVFYQSVGGGPIGEMR
jgi:hypothetical protein